MDMSCRQPAHEHVDGTRRIDGAGREHVDEKKLSLRKGMHRNVAIVVQERRGHSPCPAVQQSRNAGSVHASGACGGDDQAADECAVAQLRRGYAEEIGDDVLKGSRQARPSTARVQARSGRRGKQAVRSRQSLWCAAHSDARLLVSCAMHGSRSRVEIFFAVCSLLALTPNTRVSAQQAARSSFPNLELRVDAIDVRSREHGTLQGGAGVNIPLGYYVRLEIDGAAGITKRDNVNYTSGRVDVIARFLLDPFAEVPWGFSLGGGMSGFSAQSRVVNLVVVADLETPRVGPVMPALQLGLGGGVRFGIILRPHRAGQR